MEELRFYGERGLTISLVDTDLPESGRLCCVAADYDSLGRTPACCVSSRSSLMLGRAIEASGKAGKIMAVGSDLLDENKDFLRRGVFQNLVQKNPFGQAFMATKFLMDYLIKDVRPEPLFAVGSQMVFRSNLVLYEKNSVRFLE